MVRIAQISDIHAKPGGKSLLALERTLAWLETAEPDALIVSGDLANPPWTEAYGLVREALEDVRCPMLIVPGNKDDRAGMRAAFHRQRWDAGGPLCEAETVDGVRIIGLDVQVPGEKYGDAAPVAGWLERQLAAHSEPALVFLHQQPFYCGFPHLDDNPCRNADGLAAAIEAHGNVALLATGHGHRTIFTQWAGSPAMMCPSLAKANDLRFNGEEVEITDPPGFALHIIGDGAAVSHIVSLG